MREKERGKSGSVAGSGSGSVCLERIGFVSQINEFENVDRIQMDMEQRRGRRRQGRWKWWGTRWLGRRQTHMLVLVLARPKKYHLKTPIVVGNSKLSLLRLGSPTLQGGPARLGPGLG